MEGKPGQLEPECSIAILPGQFYSYTEGMNRSTVNSKTDIARARGARRRRAGLRFVCRAAYSGGGGAEAQGHASECAALPAMTRPGCP
eukprot:scaffold41600_cov82-Phaeocystis_antarctica.AAC.3